MADRSVAVHLKAITDQYKRSMEQAAAATKGVSSRLSEIDTAMGKADKGFQHLGGTMQNVGGTLTRSVTLPLALAGGAAVKLSTDFEKSFATMVGLAGVAAEDVDGLKQSILDLAGETAVAPQELADALYFAASAGLDAAGAMEAVEIAARASAAGMGKTEEVVGLVASAIASYGEANIDAAKATDILTATIREGRADPAELAGTLGRILPIAAQLGVEFDEVGGTVAYLSNVFGDTNRTVTALSGVLVKLVSPSKQGRQALQDMGTSVEELHATIDERGLLGALELLREKGFAGNAQALRALFDDIEGYQGALALLNDKSGTLTETLGAVSDSAGALDSAFAAMAETAGFKNTQAFAKLQIALIQIGDVLVPLLADLAEFAGVFLDAFSALPGPVQTSVIALGALVAAVGPLMSIGGKLATNWHTIGRGFDRAATGAYDAAAAGSRLRGVVAGLIALTLANELRQWASGLGDVAHEIDEVIGKTGVAQAEEFKQKIRDITDETGLFEVSWKALGRDVKNAFGEGFNADKAAHDYFDDLIEQSIATAEAFRDAAAADQEFQDKLNSHGLTQDFMASKLRETTEAQVNAAAAADESADIIDKAAGATDEYGAATEEAIDPVQALEDAIKGVTNALRSQFDPLFAAQDALLGNAEAQEAVAEAQKEAERTTDDYNRAVREHGRQSQQATDALEDMESAQRDLDSANRSAVRSALDVSVAMTELRMRVAAGDITISDAEETLRQWVAQGLITQQQAAATAYQFGLTALAADNLGRKNILIPVAMVGYEKTILQLMALDDLANRVGARSSFQYRAGVAGAFQGRALGGDVTAGTPYIVGERGPELMIPGASGTVLPNHVLEAIQSGNPSGVVMSAGSTTSTTDARSVVVNNYYPKPEPASANIGRSVRKAQLANA